MTKKVRISQKNYKDYPRQIAEAIHNTKKRFCDIPKSFTYEEVDSSKTFYIGEGDYYRGIRPDGKEASFQVVSSSTLGASGLSHKIGERFQIPSGSYLICVSYYQTYHMSVYKIL